MLVSWQSDADAADTKSELSVKSPAAHAATAHHQHPNANAATAADTQSKHPASSAAAYSATAELSENEQIAENLSIPKQTSYAEPQRITSMSQKTIERALPELVEPGWINVTHRASGFEIDLAMNDGGLHLLIEESERRQSFAGRRSQNDEWKEGIISHMLCYETEYRKLSETLSESLPTTIHNPAGLLSRTAEHIRLQPHLSVRTPRPKISSSASFIDETIAGIAMSLASPGVQSSSDSSRSWGDEA